MIKKLLKLYFVDRDDNHYDCFALFTRFRVDYEDNFIEISVNGPFMYLLNELKSNYMSIELMKYAQLASTTVSQSDTYSKAKYSEPGYNELDLDDIPF